MTRESKPEKLRESVGRALGINNQRMEMIPLNTAQLTSTEVFWLNKRYERIWGRTPERITSVEVVNRCSRFISGVGDGAKSL